MQSAFLLDQLDIVRAGVGDPPDGAGVIFRGDADIDIGMLVSLHHPAIVLKHDSHPPDDQSPANGGHGKKRLRRFGLIGFS
jgi:hypothetical protein